MTADPKVSLSESTSPAAPSALATRSVKEAAAFLFDQLVDVVKRHQPEIEPVLRGFGSSAGLPPALMARALQAQGIWFQLLSIAEQASAMRRRRTIERAKGRDELLGSFAHVLADAAKAGVTADEIRAQLKSLRIRPVITAHPTEAKRVTVLEKNRKIYLLLKDLGILALDRSRARQPHRPACAIRSSCCGSPANCISRSRPSSTRSPGACISSARSLFDLAPEMLAAFESALASHYPNERFDVTPFFQFGSWIGGDRDGNPFVTNAVTRETMIVNALASLDYYRQRVLDLARVLSISERSMHDSGAASARRSRRSSAQVEDADRIRTRNQGEAFRQYLTCVLRKLDETIATTQGRARGQAALRQRRRADQRSARARAGADREPQPVARRRSGAAGAPRGRDFPLQHRASRSAREHDAHQ